MPLPAFIALAEGYAEARTPPDKKRPQSVPLSVIAALKQRENG